MKLLARQYRKQSQNFRLRYGVPGAQLTPICNQAPILGIGHVPIRIQSRLHCDVVGSIECIQQIVVGLKGKYQAFCNSIGADNSNPQGVVRNEMKTWKHGKVHRKGVLGYQERVSECLSRTRCLQVYADVRLDRFQTCHKLSSDSKQKTFQCVCICFCITLFLVRVCLIYMFLLFTVLVSGDCNCDSQREDRPDSLNPRRPIGLAESLAQACNDECRACAETEQRVAHHASLPVTEIYCHMEIIS